MMRRVVCGLVALLAATGAGRAQEQESLPAPMQCTPWEFSGSVFTADPPGSQARALAILYGQRGSLHTQMRYNYEDLDTLSVFGGWTFTGGEALAWEVTPMLGLVGGRTDGVAPGIMLDLGWRRFALYSEAEYLLDANDSSDDFFYSWSTLTYGVTDRFAAGVVSERSKVVETDFELQVGLALELAVERLELALYSYNLGTNDAYTVLSLGGSF